MIITNQTPIKDTQKMGIKEDKIIKENHQTAKGETKRRKEQTTKKNKKKTKTSNKMAISTYLLIITLKVNGLVVPRWWRNRLERPLSPQQIHQKII